MTDDIGMVSSLKFKGNQKFVAKAREVLPWLVVYAELGRTTTYGELAEKVDVDPHTELHHILGVIGEALKEVDPDIPMIQLIVVNKKAGVVGDLGLGWFGLSKDQISRLSQAEKERLCSGEQKRVFDYRGWREILEMTGLPPVILDPPTNVSFGGGEGEDHRLLKLYVKAHPTCIGLKQSFSESHTERKLLSGDEMDVFFLSPTEWVCVEVKGKNSSESDILRGVFQCVKYRAVLNAELIYRKTNTQPVISVYLVLATNLSKATKQVAQLFEIPVFENIAIPKAQSEPEPSK